MLKNVMVAQIKKFKKQSPFIFEFCTSALGVYFLKVNKLKVNFSKVYFSKVYLSKVY